MQYSATWAADSDLPPTKGPKLPRLAVDKGLRSYLLLVLGLVVSSSGRAERSKLGTAKQHEQSNN